MSLANQQGGRVTRVERYQPGNTASLSQATQRLKDYRPIRYAFHRGSGMALAR